MIERIKQMAVGQTTEENEGGSWNYVNILKPKTIEKWMAIECGLILNTD